MGIQEIKRKRFEYLYKLWESTGGDTATFKDTWEIGEEAKLSVTETQKIVAYLMGESLIDHGDASGTVALTQKGVHEVEKSIKHVEEAEGAILKAHLSAKEAEAQNAKNASSANQKSPFMGEVNLIALESYIIGIIAGALGLYLLFLGSSEMVLYLIAIGIILCVISFTCLLKPEFYEHIVDSIFGGGKKSKKRPSGSRK
jgi:hypothetical protein